MKKYKLMTISLIVLFILISATMLVYNFYVIQNVIVREMHLKVEDTLGVNTDTDKLWFGKVVPGGISERKVDITNEYNFPIFVSIKLDGELSDYVTVSENNFVLQPAEKRIVYYYATTTKETPLGNYTGITRVVINRALFQ